MRLPAKHILHNVNWTFYRTASSRTIFSRTGQWPVTCTFDLNCCVSYLKQVEQHWQPKLVQLDRERSDNLFRPGQPEPDFCVLSMFPYPSGSLHLGHVKIYTGADIIARYNRAKGHRVLQPMGWDSFGLPAENAALQNSLDPHHWTYSNIEQMRDQMSKLGLSLDWREATSDPSFYKWTQWLFTKLFQHNLVYKSMARVNWDPVDQTVLADAQIDAEGRSWRSGAKVEQRYLRQWFVKTAALAKRLYEFDGFEMSNGIHWSQIAQIQRAWIGEIRGYVFYLQCSNGLDVVPIYTERPDFFASNQTKLLISKDHWLASKEFRQDTKVINPLTGETMEVLIDGIDSLQDAPAVPTGFNATIFNSRLFKENMDKAAKDRILNSINTEIGGYESSPKFCDWLISRQRYWGTPIPIVDCEKCGPVSIDEKHLPLQLPPVTDYNSRSKSSDPGQVKSRLEELAPPEWLETKCPKCGSAAKREADTLDTFVDSSWYYLRFSSQPNDQKPFDKRLTPVEAYFGGAEHAQGHLLYARYMYHFLKDHGYLESTAKEPFTKLIMNGYVLGRTFMHQGQYISEEQASKLSEVDVQQTFEKMSKSKGNGVNPLDLIDRYGIDATRFCVLGTALPSSIRYWKNEDYQEVVNFLRKLVLTMDQFIWIRNLQAQTSRSPEIKRFTARPVKDQQTLEKELERLTQLRNSTVIDVTVHYDILRAGRSSKNLQSYLDKARKSALVTEVATSREYERVIGDMIIMLGPLLPHLSQELWAGFASYATQVQDLYQLSKRVDEQAWPQLDKNYHPPIILTIDDDRKQAVEVSDRSLIERGNPEELRHFIKEYVTDNLDKFKFDRDKWQIDDMLIHPGFKVSAKLKSGRPKKKKKAKKPTDSDDESDIVASVQ